MNIEKIVVWKDGSHKIVTGRTDEFENDADWLITIDLHPSPSGWIEIKPGCEMPATIEGKDYSANVLVICDGRLEVMSYGYVDAEPEGGWVWSNCYGDIHGDSEWDDEYWPTHWMPLPTPPIDL